MKKCLSLIATLFTAAALPAQVISYDTASIPAALKKDADVIKRYEDIFFEVTDIDKAVFRHKTVYTVMNPEGKRELTFVAPTSKFRVLTDADIKVFDAAGKQTLRYRKKDLQVTAMGDGLVDDGKTYYLTVPASSYPVTVAYEYEFRYKGTLHYPPYSVLSPEEAVEYSSFTAKVPKDLGLRYKEKNITLKPEIKEEDKYKLYTWKVNNLAAVKSEENQVARGEGYPLIELAPNRFSMDDYEGDMSSWESFGNWYASLAKGIDVFPESKKGFFRKMVADAGTDREKVKILYEYLQKNFRYVSIQLGIGGWRPFPAAFTDDKKYGDCKGLSNYMQAALEAVNIKSYQALINREANGVPIDPKFPSNHFNHVILMVPNKGDTIWLECTSKTADFGMLDITTENRNALVVTENGGVVVPTPATRADENIFAVKTLVDLQETGEGKSNTFFTATGEYKDVMEYVINEKTDDQKEFIVNRWGFKQPDEFVLTKKGQGVELEMMVGKVPEFTAGNKMFLATRMSKLWGRKMPVYPNRKLDYYFAYPFIRTDTTVFKLPAGAKVDVLPKEKELQCAYGTYITKYWFNEAEQSVYSAAKLQLKQHRIPAAQYNEVKQFFDAVLQDDTQRIVVIKK